MEDGNGIRQVWLATTVPGYLTSDIGQRDNGFAVLQEVVATWECRLPHFRLPAML
jgi:hypothetical protein